MAYGTPGRTWYDFAGQPVLNVINWVGGVFSAGNPTPTCGPPRPTWRGPPTSIISSGLAGGVAQIQGELRPVGDRGRTRANERWLRERGTSVVQPKGILLMNVLGLSARDPERLEAAAQHPYQIARRPGLSDRVRQEEAAYGASGWPRRTSL